MNVYFSKFKPLIKELIRFYYQTNPTGGCCHIALDDGNLDDESLFFCQKQCKKAEDLLGYLIAMTLCNFTESERAEIYKTDWWGMK